MEIDPPPHPLAAPHPLNAPQTARAAIRFGDRFVIEAEARATPLGMLAVGGLVAAILLAVVPIVAPAGAAGRCRRPGLISQGSPGAPPRKTPHPDQPRPPIRRRGAILSLILTLDRAAFGGVCAPRAGQAITGQELTCAISQARRHSSPAARAAPGWARRRSSPPPARAW